jgi:hypothetical protein
LLGRQDWVSSSLSFTNGVRGSGVAATQTRTVPSFRAVEKAGGSTVTVHVGAKQTVVVNADDNLIDRVKTDVRHAVLVVSERGSFATKPTSSQGQAVGEGVEIVVSGPSDAMSRRRDDIVSMIRSIREAS